MLGMMQEGNGRGCCKWLQTCSVHQLELATIREQQLRVNGIAGGPSEAAHDAALLTNQGIQEAALAHVRPSDDGYGYWSCNVDLRLTVKQKLSKQHLDRLRKVERFEHAQAESLTRFSPEDLGNDDEFTLHEAHVL